jgi:DNA-binding LacI/PurR family transcriptional regulator
MSADEPALVTAELSPGGDAVSLQAGHPGPPDPGRRSPPTSTDVARFAGVSRSTVSNVLNGKGERFSQQTVQRVRDAATALGYVPSAAGRALVNGRSDFMVVVLPNTTLTNVQDIVEAIADDLEGYGFAMVVHFSIAGAAGDPFARLLHTVETLRPAGLIDLGGLTRDELRLLQRQGCPVISPPLNVPDTELDGNVVIGRVQVEHLVARGYVRFAYAFLADRRDDPYGRVRAQAAAEVCAARGLPAPAQVDIPLDSDGARRELAPLLARGDGPIGLICSNDEVAVAVTFAALGLGAAVPGDLAAIGVGGGAVGQLVVPRITTVIFDLHASLVPIKQAIAHSYGISETKSVLSVAQAFSVLQGQTT